MSIEQFLLTLFLSTLCIVAGGQKIAVLANDRDSTQGTEDSLATSLTSFTSSPSPPSATEISSNTTPSGAMTPPLPPARKVCDICNCTGELIDCSGLGLESNLKDNQWPRSQVRVVTFEKNNLIRLQPFANATIEKLILRHNRILRIEQRAFYNIKRLFEIDLSHNELISQFFTSDVFEGPFSAVVDEPLKALKVLNLAWNDLHSLKQDLFKHVMGIRILDLSGNPLRVIDHPTSLAISSLPSLERLDLSNCQLSDLPDHIFHAPRSLKALRLAGNEFERLPLALDDAKGLQSLILDDNPIELIEQIHGFPVLPALTELSLCGMPDLTEIGKNAMSGLSSLERLSICHNPKLTKIHELTLGKETSKGRIWPPLKQLDLSDNALRYLPSLLVGRWDKLEEMDLTNNQWSCDCDNQYLIGKLLPENGKKWMKEEELEGLRCSGPPEHMGKNLSSLSHRHLRCPDLYGARPEKDAAILVGMLIGLLVAIPLALALFVLWRRGFFFCGPQGPAAFSRAFYKRTSNNDDDQMY
ncbi:leucine-rich repeat neuronal protein 2-like [Prorops nasuta]|uniref:leucine-rich repeat neuronal protein 2-like n=1 Tax=Prorops nasuta TaxID=863751 RepID=UPI0034CDE49F